MYNKSKQHEVIQNAILVKDRELIKFNIGDKVQILTEIALRNGPQKNVNGVVEAIDGQYIMVRPNYYKHFVECYPNELKKV
jgi:hypothetical protein